MYPDASNMHTRANSRNPLVLSPADRSLIVEFLRATEDMSPERAAAFLPGVSGATLRRYRAGRMPSRMTTDVRLALRTFLQTRAEEGTPEHTAGSDPDAEAAEDTFRYFEQTIRQMGGAGDIEAGELKLRRLDALEGLRRFFSARGPVPGWWYRIKEKVETDAY